MPSSVGALVLPAPAAAPSDRSPGAPELAVLGDFFQAVLERDLNVLWTSIAAREPIVKKLSFHDPSDVDFVESDLPLLAVWCSQASAERVSDQQEDLQHRLQVLWAPAPAPQIKARHRFAFFNAFSSSISLAVRNERDPSYLHAFDDNNVEAICYGSDVFAHAGIDSWTLSKGNTFQRVPVIVQTASSSYRYPAYMATLLYTQSAKSSAEVGDAWGVARTRVYFDLAGPGPNAITRQQAVVAGGFSSGFDMGFDSAVGLSGFTSGFDSGFA